MALASNTLSFCFITPSSSSSSSSLKHKPLAPSTKRLVSCSLVPTGTTLEPPSSSSSSYPLVRRSRKSLDPRNDDVLVRERRNKKLATRPCEVYVCNLPRSCNAAHLLDFFKPHGTVLSVEVCRNAETGESKGCGYVTMGSIYSARNAVAALDGTDVGGREMRVRFSVEMNAGRGNPEKMNYVPKRVIYYEAPHKLYVGNLDMAVRPEELRKLFSRFGNVVSARVLQDHMNGRRRVYAFLSFLSDAERAAAMSLNGMEFYGRQLIVGGCRED